MLVFRKIWRVLFTWNIRFEICLFALLPIIARWEIGKYLWADTSVHKEDRKFVQT